MNENENNNEYEFEESVGEEPKFFTNIIDFQQCLAEVGRIKIGEKGRERTGKGSQPKWFEHFLITQLKGDSTKNYLPHKFLMDKICPDWNNPDPTKRTTIRDLDIILPYDDPDLNFVNWLQSYDDSQFICQGNGRKAWRIEGEFKNTKNMKEKEHLWKVTGGTKKLISCNPTTCPLMINGQCGIESKLGVFLPQMEYIGGVFAFRTGSWESYMNIRSSLYYMHNEITHGILAELPCVLTVRLKMKKTPFGMVNLPVVNLMYRGNRQQLRDWAVERAKERQEKYLTIEAYEAIRKRRLQKIEMRQNIDDAAAINEYFKQYEEDGYVTDDIPENNSKEKQDSKTDSKNNPNPEKTASNLNDSSQANTNIPKEQKEQNADDKTQNKKEVKKEEEVKKNPDTSISDTASKTIISNKEGVPVMEVETMQTEIVDEYVIDETEKKQIFASPEAEIDFLFGELGYSEKEKEYMKKKYGKKTNKLKADLEAVVKDTNQKNSRKQEDTAEFGYDDIPF